MFATAAVATALTLTALAPTATMTDVSTDPEVIQAPVFNRTDLKPFEGGTYGGKCPPTHPYLYDEFYAHGRWVPHGVHVVTGDALVAVYIGQRYPTPVPTSDIHENYFSGINGDYLNWATHDAALAVTMVCTSNTLKAWEGPATT
jgi:hypothetical protein